MVAYWFDPHRQQHTHVKERIQGLPQDTPLMISAIALGEIEYGFRVLSEDDTPQEKRRRRLRPEQLVDPVTSLELGVQENDLWSERFWLTTDPNERGAHTVPKVLSEEAVARYERDGFYFPVRVLSADDALSYRRRLESAEAQHGEAVARLLRSKPHLVFTWANALIRHPRLLDAVEDLLGPHILCWGSSFFIKDAQDPAYVSWHQDSTYWGLEPHDVLTAWVALSDVPVASGAMQFLAGSHTLEQVSHHDTFHADNLLSRGQVVDMAIDDAQAVDVPLRAGEMSLHHVRLIHGSAPNLADDRRIGLAIRYMAPHVRQIHGSDSATLVRGEDPYGHFVPEPMPQADLDAAALAAHQAITDKQRTILYRGADAARPTL